MIKFICCLLLLCCIYICKGQSVKVESPIKIGQKIPDLEFNGVLNASYTSINFSSFKDRLILLDFWATWCSACVREFPKLNTLQDQFKEALQVLLINASSDDDINKITIFLKKYQQNNRRILSMPIIIGDKQLRKYFPHKSLPHIVWIYKGKLYAVTSADEVTATNIQAVLNGDTSVMRQKEDVINFDSTNPLLMNGDKKYESFLLQRSVFTRYINGLGSKVGRSVTVEGTFRKMFFINQGIIKLYTITNPGLAGNRIMIDLQDQQHLIYEETNNKLDRANLYCYELTMPINTSENEMYTTIHKDLDKQFGLFSRMERRTVNCYILTRTGATDSLFKAKYIRKKDSFGTEGNVHNFYNQPLSVLLQMLNYQVPGKPFRPVVLDETGYKGMVDLELSISDFEDLDAVKKALLPYGLNLEQGKREINMLVISNALSETNQASFF